MMRKKPATRRQSNKPPQPSRDLIDLSSDGPASPPRADDRDGDQDEAQAVPEQGNATDVLHTGSEADADIKTDVEEDGPDENDDPIVREYDVFLNDGVSEKLMLLQYPNRPNSQPYNESKRSKPLELRIKPGAGLVEVDVPMVIYDNYDREKAVRFGNALKKSTDDRAGGSLGLAGGFGVGFGPSRGVRRGAGEREPEISQDTLEADFQRASDLGRVLNKQILGGQVDPLQDGKPIYMIGVFREDQLHLTPVDSIAQLRPQFHHLDAAAEQERAAMRLPRESGAAGRQQETRAVQMTAKSADGDDMDTAEITKTLKAAQEENWTRLGYADEDSSQAWSAYDRLFVDNTKDAPRLQSRVTGAEYLDAVSACKVSTTQSPRKTAAKKGSGRAAERRDEDGVPKPKPTGQRARASTAGR